MILFDFGGRLREISHWPLGVEDGRAKPEESRSIRVSRMRRSEKSPKEED
jgi:hypothetical protein